MWNGEMWKSGALAPRKEYVLSGLLAPVVVSFCTPNLLFALKCETDT